MVCSERNLMSELLLSLMILLGGIAVATAQTEDLVLNPSKLEMFVDELPDMPKVRGFKVVDGIPKQRSLKIGMYRILWKFHRDLPPTPVFAYGTSRSTATVPGPTIEAVHGVDTFVRWQNYLPRRHILPWDETITTAIPRGGQGGIPTVVHLHGGINGPESDGHSDSWFTARFRSRGSMWTKRKYHYHNGQHPGNLWYHDHAMGLTRVNTLAGLIGAYVIRHPAVETPLGLPAGDEFDRVLVVFDRGFRVDSSLYMNSTGNNPSIHPQWQPEYFGDAIIVNGKAWPYMNVRRRKYRFRIINASNARFYRFYFTDGLDFVVVGADSAYLGKPVKSKDVLLAPSEIIDVVVDFSRTKSHAVILANDAPYPYPGGDPVNESNGRVMKFIVEKQPHPDNSRIPKKLIKYQTPDVSAASHTRYITLLEYTSKTDEPTHLYLNGRPYSDPATETPRPGTSEVWYVINLTEDNHPLHIHLGLFLVLDQTSINDFDKFKDCMTKNNDAERCQLSRHARGTKVNVLPYEKGWKNVHKMMPGNVTKLLVKFAYIHSNSSYPFDATSDPGYSYHCHILDHEDNMMMRPLKFVN